MDWLLIGSFVLALLVSSFWMTNYIVRSLAVPVGSPTDRFLGWFAWYRLRTQRPYWYRILATKETIADGTLRHDYWTWIAPPRETATIVEYYAHGRLVQSWEQ